MALKIALEPLGPGSARLVIDEVQGVPERVALAIQRNNGNWLGPNRQWQVTPYWHPQFSAEPRAEGLRLAIGVDLVDSIIDAGGSPLLVRVRSDGREDAGVLRIRGELVGSGAAAPPQPTIVIEAAPIPEPAAESAADLDPGRADTERLAIPPVVTPSRGRPWRWLVLGTVLVAVVAIAVVGLGVWSFGRVGGSDGTEITPPTADRVVPGEPRPEPTRESPSSAPTGPDPHSQSPLKGIAFARDFLSGSPTPEVIFARAEQAEKDGDCPAAYALYSGAANKDPALAARLARRYDPQTSTPGPCIGAPDIPYAIVYYNDAAEAGDVAVQRRLGQLMVEREPAGPTRQAGLRWLRKAAEAGDTEARHLLEQLADH